MADVLKATLRPAGGEAHSLVEILPECLALQGSAGDLADGSDATGSYLQAWNQGFKASGQYREEWNVTTASVPGSIAFIRILARVRLEDYTGSGVNALGEFYHSVGGANEGPGYALGAVATRTLQLDRDPVDGQPWTNARINSKKFGWYVTAHFDFDMFDDVARSWCSDFAVEVYAREISMTAVASCVAAIGSLVTKILVGDLLPPYLREKFADARRWAGF